ncbi:LysR family transcriptional regulator [Nocardia sp. NPDC057272]|uniref:LysR family transcriptional regulator n=1 Tax=Nocardia sp. NPDC057272 TaxID=3346079 RepID=UPI00362FA634
MLFRQLEYFVALARERHFARAAKACYVSQPALSEAIRKLEHELGVPLVRRARTFEGLTPEGERLVLWARRIIADRGALEHEVRALQTGLTGELRIGVVPAASSTVALLTDPFCTEHPLMRVRVETSLRSLDIVERIRRFELDAGIVYAQGVDTSGLTLTPLYAERHVLVAGSALVAGRTEISWADALELPMCLLPPGMRGRQLIDDALATLGLTAAPQLESDSVATLLEHARTGRWACIVPQPWVAALGPTADIRVFELTDPVVTAQIVLVTAAVEPGSVLTTALIGTARATDFAVAPRPATG